MKKGILVVVACMLVLMLACGCAAKSQESSELPAASPEWIISEKKTETAEEQEEPVDGYNAEPNTLGLDMVGEWVEADNPRIRMTVESTYDGFGVFIRWSDSAVACTEWHMSGQYDDVEDGRIVSNDCKKLNITYGDGGEIISEEILYDDGNAQITYVNGMLYWNDLQEDAGDEMMFERLKDEPEVPFHEDVKESESAAPQPTKTPSTDDKKTDGKQDTEDDPKNEPVDGYNAEPNTNGQEMVGKWIVEDNPRVTMTIKAVYDGFSVVISWSDSAATAYEWRMTGNFVDEEQGRIVSNDCKCVLVTYDENGVADEKLVYDDGTARITMVNNMLYWYDAQQDAGEDLIFEKD